MSEQEQLMNDLMNLDLEIIDTIRELHKENWTSDSLKQQIGDSLKIRDEKVVKLMSLKGNDHQCDCGHDHSHE
ncbi:MAG: hypothetical protein MAG458_01213 [Nitrosopumilus sp.]|nr:hypothetical protein [Nitrosopumilus sp.]